MSWSNCGPFPLLVSLPLPPSLTSISCSQAVPGLNAPRGIVRARRPLRRLSRRRRRGARYSLSHSADTVSERARRGANFDVKLHHNNGSQHVLRGGGGGRKRRRW